MKKVMFAAMAALAITSCSQNEEMDAPSQKVEIGFNTMVSKTTRAAVTDVTALGVTGFTVYAYNVGDGTGKLTNAIMDGVEVTGPSTNWTVTGGPYYWPLTDNVDFFAFPTGVSATYDVAVDAKFPTIEYTVVDEPANQVDLVLAKVAAASKITETVTLPFAHVLTQVNFSAKGADAFKYVISSIEIEGVSKSGTYAFETGEWTTSGDATASYNYALAVDASVEGTTAVKLDQANGALMLMPQAMTADAKIKVEYKVYDGTTLLYETPVDGAVIELNGSDAWASGKKVRYTLSLANGAATIKFKPEVGEWGSEDDKPLPKP